MNTNYKLQILAVSLSLFTANLEAARPGPAAGGRQTTGSASHAKSAPASHPQPSSSGASGKSKQSTPQPSNAGKTGNVSKGPSVSKSTSGNTNSSKASATGSSNVAKSG